MTFELIPTIDTMIELYEMPRDFKRFQEYLKILQGNTKDALSVPVTGYNPMAKPHVKDKLIELKKLKIEQLTNEALQKFNTSIFSKISNRTFKVAINLLDDSQGGWTNRYTNDYDSKFRFHGLFNKNFCAPIFWVSENITQELIRKRIEEYIYRTVYWLQYPKPISLKHHLNQEIFVATQLNNYSTLLEHEFKPLAKLYSENQNTENFNIIFNFFYGDRASASLAFATYGIVENLTGFDYAKSLAKNNQEIPEINL